MIRKRLFCVAAVNTRFNLGFPKPATLAEATAKVGEVYHTQAGLNRVYNVAKTADGGKHFIGTMFQAGNIHEMTELLNIYPNPSLPYFDLALSEHYNTPGTSTLEPLQEMFERVNPLSDNVQISNGAVDGNFYFRLFRTAPPTTALLQDALMANRDFRDYYAAFHPTGASNGGSILKMFGKRYEGDGEQKVRSVAQRELLHTTLTNIHAMQYYPRPMPLGGINIFGYDFFSSTVATGSTSMGNYRETWTVTPDNIAIRKEQQDFLAFWGVYNLGIVFQEPKIPALQGETFLRVQVGTGMTAEEREAERAIKTVVRYHDGFYYVALLNTRVNITMPPELTTGTVRYLSWGGDQAFIPSASVRVLLPSSDVLTSGVELVPTNGGAEAAQTLETLSVPGVGARQALDIATLDAAEGKIFRFRAVHPAVTAMPVVLLAEAPKAGAEISSDDGGTKQTRNLLMDNELLQNTIMVFPNPATESATLRFPRFGADDAPVFSLSDVYGNVITQRVITSPTLTLNTRPLPSGVYVCTVHGRTGAQTTLLHIVK